MALFRPRLQHEPRARACVARVCAPAGAKLRRPILGRPTLPLLLVLVAGTAAGGCSGDQAGTAIASEGATPQRGGTVVMGSAQEPPNINSWLATGSMGTTAVITDPLKSPWVRIDAAGRWQPVLAESVPTMANGGVEPDGTGMVIHLAIKPRAHWSDGTPITCRDLHFTWRTAMDDRWEIGTRIGWDQVTAIDCPMPQHADIHLATRHAAYLPDLLATAPLPEHELRGKDFNNYWSQRITVSSGPFIFDHWRRGVELALRRNPNYWDAGDRRRPYLDRLEYRFVPDANSMKLDLRMEEVDLIGLPPDTNLPQELAAIRTARHVELPGSAWEQVTFNTERPPVDDVRVRRAIAHAIDRDAIANVVLRHQVEPLQSTLLPGQPGFLPVFARYRRDQALVDRHMTAAGYRRSGAGPWSRHGTTARLDLKTTSGNPLRIKLVQLMQEQLKAAGFDVTISTGKPEIFFSQVISHGNFHLSIYSFGSGSDPSQTRLFSCDEIPRSPSWQGKNNYRYCNRRLTRLSLQADAELNLARRRALLATIQQTLARDVPVLPLFQPPDTLAWSRRLHGVRPNPPGRHVWNVQDWWLQE